MVDIMPRYLLCFWVAVTVKVNAAVFTVLLRKCFSSFKGSCQIFGFVLLGLPLPSLFCPF